MKIARASAIGLLFLCVVVAGVAAYDPPKAPRCLAASMDHGRWAKELR